MKKDHYCIDCKAPLQRSFSFYRGLKLDSLQCPRCNKKVFDEERTMKALTKVEAARVKKEYKKSIFKIGHSLAMTFPKEVAELFNLQGKSVTLRPDVEKRTIRLKIA